MGGQWSLVCLVHHSLPAHSELFVYRSLWNGVCGRVLVCAVGSLTAVARHPLSPSCTSIHKETHLNTYMVWPPSRVALVPTHWTTPFIKSRWGKSGRRILSSISLNLQITRGPGGEEKYWGRKPPLNSYFVFVRMFVMFIGTEMPSPRLPPLPQLLPAWLRCPETISPCAEHHDGEAGARGVLIPELWRWQGPSLLSVQPSGETFSVGFNSRLTSLSGSGVGRQTCKDSDQQQRGRK